MGCICTIPVQHLTARVAILERQFVELEKRNVELEEMSDRLADMLAFGEQKDNFKRLHEIHDFDPKQLT